MARPKLACEDCKLIYARKGMKMNKKQSIQYKKLKKAVLEFEKPTISTSELWSLINRVTYDDKKRYFGFTENSRFNARLRYNRFFIQILQGEDIIELTQFNDIWKINKLEKIIDDLKEAEA